MTVDMEIHIFFWLRFVRQCPIVLFERTPRPICGQPDVLGVTQSRYLIEVECKRSMSDFRANTGKQSMIWRRQGFKSELFPRQFYFCVTEAMANSAEKELPDFAGLCVCGNTGRLQFTKNAPVQDSRRLSLKECSKISKLMCSQYYNTYISAIGRNEPEIDWGIEYRI